MWILVVFFSLSTFAQELDLEAIHDLEEKLPSYNIENQKEIDRYKDRQSRRHRPLINIVKFKKIRESGTHLGSISAGTSLVRIDDNKVFTLSYPIYVRYYRLQDEHAFKYLINKDGQTIYKVNSNFVNPINEELTLYEPPRHYTTAEKIKKTEYDEKINLLPEAGFYLGVVTGDFMKDLFNDERAQSGVTNKFALNVLGNWNLPIKAGLVFHFDQASYDLTSGGKILYSSISFGPQFKTKEFDFFSHSARFQTQYRYGHNAKATGQMTQGDVTFNFKSSDFLSSFEFPIKNDWGEFVWGIFFEAQWLNLKNQTEIVQINASNEVNKAWGLSLSQVFQ